jgi:hypothetical protein
VAVRNVWHRILVGEEGAQTLIPSEDAVQIQETLIGAVTRVATFSFASETYSLARGVPVAIHQVILNSTFSDGYLERQQFQGTIDVTTATTSPHKVKVTCTGVLALLRFTPDHDIELTGTDITAARLILTTCGVPYTTADVGGWGYPIAQIKPIFWKKGQSGAEILNEIDRVFGCATIEVGEGRVVRFLYSLVPADYASGLYGGAYSPDVQKSFFFGQSGSTFYANEAEYGHADQIQNYWRVTGLQYEGEEGAEDEGCSYQIYAEGKDVHPLLGADVFVGPNEFSSEFIQTEELAKAIAVRLMRWHNREANKLRIETANDANVSVGDLVAVRNPVYGIGLATATSYVVTNINRDGDFMTIDLVGGEAGESGVLTAGIEKCCGTQLEDGTCEETGTNPEPSSPPDPGIPPDPDVGFCDPIAEPSCDPLGWIEPVLPPNVEDPFLDCTEVGQAELMGTGERDGDTDISGWFVGDDDDDITTPDTCIQSSWRVLLASGYTFERDNSNMYWSLVGGTVDKIGRHISAAIAHNTTANDCTTPGEEKTYDNDTIFGAAEVVCISGQVYFCREDGELFVGLPAGDSASTGARISFLAEPGFTFSGVTYGVTASTENQAPIKVGDGPPNRSLGILTRDNGGLGGFPVPIRTEASWSVCFDIASDYQRVIYGGDFGSGYMEDERQLTASIQIPPDPICAHPEHRLVISVQGASTETEDGCISWVRVNEMGSGTCVENPEYEPVAHDTGL